MGLWHVVDFNVTFCYQPMEWTQDSPTPETAPAWGEVPSWWKQVEPWLDDWFFVAFRIHNTDIGWYRLSIVFRVLRAQDATTTSMFFDLPFAVLRCTVQIQFGAPNVFWTCPFRLNVARKASTVYLLPTSPVRSGEGRCMPHLTPLTGKNPRVYLDISIGSRTGKGPEWPDSWVALLQILKVGKCPR